MAEYRGLPGARRRGGFDRTCDRRRALNSDALKLTVYFGEHARAGRTLLADALIDVFEKHRLEASILLRGAEGFGLAQRLRTQRLLTLSEDLPLVAAAVDGRERIAACLPEVAGLVSAGLMTLERARTAKGSIAPFELPHDLEDETKLTVICGRREQAGGRPAFMAIVDLLRRHRIAGATVLLGVDGTAGGVRRRARFFGRNIDVPLMIVAVGSGGRVAAALDELDAILERPLVTLERVRVCKRDGKRLALPRPVSRGENRMLQMLTVYAGEQASCDGRPLYVELIRRLRAAGAGGATALRGIWGYHSEHALHRDRLLSLRRDVPVVCVVIDEAERAIRWFEIVDAVTAQTGLVTSELVPAARAVAGGHGHGALRLTDEA